MDGNIAIIAALVAVAAAVVAVLVIRNSRGAKGSPGQITIVKGPRQGETIELQAGRTRIGALDDNDIVLHTRRIIRWPYEDQRPTWSQHS